MPLFTLGIEEEFQANEQKKRSAEAHNAGVSAFDNRRIMLGVVQRQINRSNRAQMAGNGHDDDGEDNAHPEHSD